MSEREPITAELRAALDVDREFMRADGTVVAQTFCVDRDDFDRCCDAIDAVHAGLERENAELRERVAVLDESADSMHDGGSITDELRKVAVKTECANGRCEKLYRGDLEHIADRIDVEHQKALDEWKAKHGQMWLKGYSECHAELLEGNETLASDLERCGWIRLPKDADGVPVHIGDVMAYADNTKPMEVVALVPPAVFLTEEGPRYADMCRHYHAPTVEDLIREAILNCVGHSPEYWDEPIAECVAKLRLTEGEDA